MLRRLDLVASAVVVAILAGTTITVSAQLVTQTTNKATDNPTSRLKVHIPHKLWRENGYDHREALFGMPPYGGAIATNVYYAASSLCDPNVDTSTGYPTREVDPKTNKQQPWPAPYILMVDRGDCTFVKKVRNAQRSGAAGVIIADNTCLCSDEECMKTTKMATCENQEPIMADDGSGADISIPSMLMFKTDADLVKDELTQNRPVQVEMAWSLPTPDDRVEYDLWTTPADQVSKEFFKNFKSIALALGKKAYFTPHMYIYDGVRSHCQGNPTDSFCYNLCTNGGRYCATDPDNDLEKGISGADVVRESLRRLCIWNNYGATDGIGKEWWDYVYEFNSRCGESDYFMNEDCIKDAYKHSNVNGDKIEACMKDTGGTVDSMTNSRLESELKSQEQRGVVVIPTAFVNSAPIRGALTASNVFSAICSGYAEGTAPNICKKCVGCSDVVGCVNKGKCNSYGGPRTTTSSDGVSTHTFTMSMLIVIGVFVGLGVWHYNKTREEMREQVRGILAEYMPLEDNDHGMNGGVSPMAFARGGGHQSLMS